MGSNRVRRWLRRRQIFTGRLAKVRYYESQQDLPDVPRANEIAVVGTAAFPKWLLIDCPCGAGHTILLPLSARANPHWDLRNGEKGPSVHPSVDRKRYEGPRCHFWLRDGRVYWV